jgi:hypothetical protein
MKHLLIMIFLIACGFSGMSQNSRPINDPTYSVHNYKHPNKAAYARKHNLDKSTFLETSTVASNDNYKQPHNKRSVVSSKAVVETTRVSAKKNQSYKHPFGL